MNDFIYSYPMKVYFGTGAAQKAAAAELGKYGKTVLLAYGGGSVKANGVYDEMVALLKQADKEIVEFSGIPSNPTYAKVQAGAALCREKNVDFILAVGDGSVIDCCKVISAQAVLDEDIYEMEYSKGRFPTAGIPMGAVVTASGTGAEMNGGAVITYPGSHSPLLEFAYNEKGDNARPALSTHIENLADYDYIFIGYPNWNADLPMPMYSFFEEYDFSGKTIIPFVTHGGSGFFRTVRTIESLEPNATVVEAGLSVSRGSVPNAQAAVKTWTDSLLAK